MNKISLIETGITKYREVWTHQKSLMQKVLEQGDLHYMILTEHHPVVTLGKSGSRENLRAAPEELEKHGIEYVEIDRGGDVTFHGPGQLVGYPILNLNYFKKDINWYLRSLEQVIIETLREFDLTAGRIPGLTGVWIGDKKLCAIGVKVSRWITMHGFALNIDTNLDYFDYIVPCGIREKGITSISELIGNTPPVKDVKHKLLAHFEKIFDVTIIPAG